MPLTSNIDQFLRETNREVEKLLEQQQSQGKKIVLQAYDSIINLSPVATGLFRTSNILTINTRDNQEYTRPNQQRLVAGEFLINATTLKNGDQIIIQNNLQYGPALEAGHSRQAPQGIYGVTEQRIRRLL